MGEYGIFWDEASVHIMIQGDPAYLKAKGLGIRSETGTALTIDNQFKQDQLKPIYGKGQTGIEEKTRVFASVYFMKRNEKGIFDRRYGDYGSPELCRWAKINQRK